MPCVRRKGRLPEPASAFVQVVMDCEEEACCTEEGLWSDWLTCRVVACIQVVLVWDALKKWHGVEARGCRTTRKRLQHDPDRLGAGLQTPSNESELPLTAADI